MAYANHVEMRRLWRPMMGVSLQYFYPLMDYAASAHAIDSPRTTRLWTWKDSTRIVEFYRKHLTRAAKYGLDIGHTNPEVFSKQQLKEKEDQLVDYFLHEMRKAPVAA